MLLPGWAVANLQLAHLSAVLQPLAVRRDLSVLNNACRKSLIGKSPVRNQQRRVDSWQDLVLVVFKEII